MRWWTRMLGWLPWNRHPLPVSQLDAALAANTAAHKRIAAEEAQLSDQLAEQQHKTEEMLDEIQRWASKGRRPSPALVTIAHTLKSLERPS